MSEARKCTEISCDKLLLTFMKARAVAEKVLNLCESLENV